MNFNCFICQQPAVKVCVHPDCQQPPFICNGPCVNKAATLIHTHNKETKFISMQEYHSKLQEFKTMLDPPYRYKQYFDSIKKKAIIMKDDLNAMIKKIDEYVQRYLRELTGYLKLNNTDSSLKLLNKLEETTDGKNMIGKEIKVLVDKQNMFKREKLQAFEAIKKQFDEKIEGMTVNDTLKDFVFFDERLEKCKLLVKEGDKLREQRKYQQFLNLLNQAKLLYDFDDEVYYQSGISLQYIRKYQQALQYYKQCLKINPQNSDALNMIANIYYQKQDYQQAIKYYSKQIELDGSNWYYLLHRGICYKQLKKYKEAHQDFSKASELKPQEESLKSLIKQIQYIMKQQRNEHKK